MLAWLTPLFHGVELTRALSLGTVAQDPLAAVVDVAYLSIMFAIGVVALCSGCSRSGWCAMTALPHHLDRSSSAAAGRCA